MEAGAFYLLLLALTGISSTLSFYGDSITFQPAHKQKDGTYKVTFHHRQNGRSSCQDKPLHTCESEVCTSFVESSVLQTDQDDTGQGRWCQSEMHATATVRKNQTSFSLKQSGCCWGSNVDGKTKWTSEAELDLGSRSDSHALNSCPLTTTVSSLRVPQNCFSPIHILAHDPDGDRVRCRFSSDAAAPANFTLDESKCVLSTKGEVDVGVHVFELMLEDFSRKNITLTYADGTSVFREGSDMNSPPLCKVKLQFSMEILPPLSSCEHGLVQPVFLSKTPSHGDVLHATMGQKFKLYAQAKATEASINDFQVSGPQNMTKEFKAGEQGTAELILSWTPQHSDLYRIVPVCFTAETNQSQSDMRCVVVLVTQAALIQGTATVTCSPNKMTVALDKSSMPGIDVNFLQLIDSSCSLTSNGTHIMGVMSFSTCGTKLLDKGDFLVFANEILSYELPSEVIIRRKAVKIEISCQFPKTVSISSYYNLQKSDYIFTESNFGSFGYTFEIYNDNNFTSKVEASKYPVEVMLLDTMYMGIQAESELPSVTLFVESCKATPNTNPENVLSYDLVKNGCLKDETVVVYPSNQKTYNFEVQAFKFNGNYEQVYITCSVILCEPGTPYSRCAQGCLSDPSRRRRRSLGKETFSHSITQGPFRFIEHADPIAAMDQNLAVVKKSPAMDVKPSVMTKSRPTAEVIVPSVLLEDTESRSGRWGIEEILSANTSTFVFASAFFVSMVMLVAVVVYFTRKRNEEDCKVLLNSSYDN
ncbi:uncharacterized protein LOC117471634 [Trematomus bernacchii]|uniref:uncharacterized protein LOC117471634 n=1 Tax=Trematomus bernacchii TaxID=40690 RepID=UPI00146E49C9|nr:uncharacterized protein LOC117471634 [Trematomus bernacchii]